MYFYGRGVPKDLAKAFSNYEKSVQLGYEPGKTAVARHLIEGSGVAQDYKKAFSLLSDITHIRMNGQHQLLLGKLYEEGKGTEQDLVEAYKYFSVAVLHSKGVTPTHPQSLKKKAAVEARLTPAQIAEVEEWIKRFKPVRFKNQWVYRGIQ